MTREGCCRASKQRRSLRRKLSHGGQRQHQLRESSRASYDSQRHNTAVGCGTQLIEASWIALPRLPLAGPKRYTDHGTTSLASEIFYSFTGSTCLSIAAPVIRLTKIGQLWSPLYGMFSFFNSLRGIETTADRIAAVVA